MRRSLVLLVVLGLLGAAAGRATARVVVQHSIAGIELQMTKAQVRERLGRPARVRTGRNDFGRYSEFVYPRVTVSFQSGSRVTALRTASRLERTRRGVGVGSTEAQVRARVAGVHCRTESGFRHCFVGRFLPGRTVTDFRIRKGRVTSILVGFVLD